MSVLYIVLCAITLILCIVTIAMILLQNKRSAGISEAFSGAGGEKTFYDKNKGRTIEGKLEQYTKITGTVVLILCVVLSVLK